MFDSFHIKHPETQPSWLAKWPEPDQIDQQFSPVLRRIACAFASKLTEASLEWNDNLIRARMGAHMCTWTKTPSGKWLKRCTCGAPEGKCPHVYITCLLLQKVFYQEKWLEKPQGTTGRTSYAHFIPSYRTRPVQQELPRDNSPLFSSQAALSNQPHQLIVEVDFKHQENTATLRFYDRLGQMNEPMRLNALYNLGFRLKRGEKLAGWNQQDRDFLLWTFQAVSKIPWNSRNLTVLKLPRNVFTIWQKQWKTCPERFVERYSQAYLHLSNITTPVNLTVDLCLEEDFVRLKADFILPGGTALPVHEFFSQLESNPEKSELLKKIKTYDPPIPWPILSDFFSKHPPRIKRSLIPQHLGELVNGRLDIVRGDCVEIQSGESVPATLTAMTSGNQFVIEARLGGDPLPLDSSIIPNATIRDQQDHFIITLPGQEQAAKVRTLLTPDTFQDATRNKARLLFPQTTVNARKLKELWDQLPPDMHHEEAPSLAYFLTPEKGLGIQAVITTKEEGPLAMLDLQWNVEGQQISHAELLRIARSNQFLFKSQSGTWLDISREEAQRALESLGAIDLTPGKENPILAARASSRIQQLQESLGAMLAPSTHQFLQRIAQEPPPELPETDPALNATLRSYQMQGAQFLIDRTACGAGPILADDMGLGKTVQVLAALDAWRRHAARQHRNFQALIVAPASVMTVWKQQAEMFCPKLSVNLLRGTPEQRHQLIRHSREHLLVTHYQLARIDHEVLQEKSFDFLVLDEAQAVKNPETQVTQAIHSLHAEHAIALSGTPLENSITDLWSIMNCINPGFLGPLKNYIVTYGSSADGLSKLNRKIRPLVLRRTKKMVAQELPPKTEQTILIDMTPEQRDLYTREVAIGKLKLKANGPGEILGVLTRLRQICCHPDLAAHKRGTCDSAKLDRLLEQLTTLHDSGHAALVFSQFTTMLDIVAEELQRLQLPYLIITGATSLAQREKLVEQFQNATEPIVFLLSLKAAGTGLTLTRADYVFLFDPWWNPAVEQQAIDRTHRIGQTNPVVAYRFITADSVEEKVSKLLEEKRELFNAVLQNDEDDTGVAPSRLTYEELRSLID